MSLFKTRDLWSTVCGENDVFDYGCLKTSNLNGNSQDNEQIIVGSYNGYLRIYNPSPNKDSKGKIDNTYKATDLIIEKSFQLPIIQLETGRFVSTNNKIHIAILFPRKLAIYELIEQNGSVDHGNQYSLKFIYEHMLQRTSFNMCKGSFGGSNSLSNNELHEYLCVQSMDGMLSIFEYESLAITCFLPNTLLPGPLKYIPKNDSFITVSSSWFIESYRYQALASNAESLIDRKVNTKKVQADFMFNLGESALSIELVGSSNNLSILVLGERNLFCLNENLILKFIKKFDFNPSCLVINSYRDIPVNFLIGTHSKLLYVHEEVRVKWAAQFDHVPVQMQIARINNQRGIIVSLSENGHLYCSYLGTDPPSTQLLNSFEEKNFDYKQAEKEYRKLQSKIKEAIVNTGAVFKNPNQTKSGLLIDFQIPTNLDSTTRAHDTQITDLERIPSITIKIQLKSAELLKNVKLTYNCNLPLVAVPDSSSFTSIGGVPIDQEISFYLKTKHVPFNLNVNIIATYSLLNDSTRVQEHKIQLPFKLIAKVLSQTQVTKKQNDFKIIFDTNKSCINTNELFADIGATASTSSGNLVNIHYYGGNDVSIQASKSSNRYRIQSDSFESMWLVANEFIKRITKSQKDFSIVYQDVLPNEEYKNLMDKHLQLRINSERYKEMIEQSSIQFRAIQKRILSKFKDKTPTPLDNLDALLEATYRQITNLADRYESNRNELELTSHSLKCATCLYVLLISLSQNLTKNEIDVLNEVMSIDFVETNDLGWEEIVSASLTNLIRTTLAKNTKEQLVNQQTLKMPQDILKIEKSIKTLVDKIEKGATLVTGVSRQKSN